MNAGALISMYFAGRYMEKYHQTGDKKHLFQSLTFVLLTGFFLHL